MTGYYISVGYNSAFSYEEVQETLFQIGREVARQPDKLIAEVLRFDAFSGSLVEYAEPFERQSDKTIQFEEQWPGFGDEEEWEPQIKMYASGGNPGREIKEAFRRAYIRLVLTEMHKRKMEINIAVH